MLNNLSGKIFCMERMITGQRVGQAAWRSWKVGSTWLECDYELMVFPEGEGGQKVKQLAAELHAALGKDASFPEVPSIRIASFQAREEMEETLIRWIQRVCHMQKRFRVDVDGPFKGPEDIAFLRVRDHGPFRKLADSLGMVDQYIRSCGEPPVEWAGTVYCRLSAGVGEERAVPWKPWDDMVKFQTHFLVHSLVLMKMQKGRSTTELVNVFPLYP